MPTLALNDNRWSKLKGGYRLPYDVSIPLKSLSSGADKNAVWLELWEELHHQGDVGEASYAAIPSLVDICIAKNLIDWNLFHLANVIEICRTKNNNPPMPKWLGESYREAWGKLFIFSLEALKKSKDDVLIRTIISTIALYKKQPKLARIMTDLDEGELNEFYDQMFEDF